MKAARFFSMAYDIRHHPKIDMLRDMQGGMVAFGRWVALMGILYDAEGVYDLTPKVKRQYLMRELETDEEGLRQFLFACANCDLLDLQMLEAGKVTSEGICNQLSYVKQKSEAGKKGMRKRWNKDAENER